MKKEVFTLMIFTFAALLLFNSVAALEPCQSGGLTTSIFKDYQMIYPNEDFLRIDNRDSLNDLEQLKDLTCLQYLDATDWGVKGDIANLNNLVNLEVLSLYSNPEVYGDLCSLSGLTKLRILKFAFDPKVYGDISCLKNLNLETFAMTYTNISGGLSDLSHMTKLKAVYVSGTGISGDISSLSELTAIEELGISDEYPGNPNIVGDLSSLDKLTKLKKVSLFSTRATNCEQFTNAHPNIPQGGCSKDSLKTLRVHNIRAEKKIGKERYEGPPPDYGNEAEDAPGDKQTDERGQVPVQEQESKGNIFTRIFGWIKNLFRRESDLLSEANAEIAQSEGMSDEDRKDLGPPKECIIDGKFIGKEKCKAMMEKVLGNAPDGGPPKECFIDGKFIGEGKCRAMMENGPSGNIPGGSDERQPQGEKGWCQSEEECDRLIKE